jgi:hypothetical protein
MIERRLGLHGDGAEDTTQGLYDDESWCREMEPGIEKLKKHIVNRIKDVGKRRWKLLTRTESKPVPHLKDYSASPNVRF